MGPLGFVKTAQAARLPAADALLLDSACPDIFSTHVFAVGRSNVSPPIGRIRDQICSNIHRVPVLSRRLCHDPIRAGFPYWIADNSPAGSHIVEAGTGGTWAETLTTLVALTEDTVDPFEHCWKIHVFRNVTGAPQSTGSVTVVVLQISHTATDGRGAAQVLRLLFGGKGDLQPPVEGLSSEPNWLHSALGVASSAVALTRTYWRSRKSPNPGPCEPLSDNSATAPNVPPGDHPVVARTILLSRGTLKSAGLTITETALIATSAALPRSTNRRYQCELPVAVPPGALARPANALVNVFVDLPEKAGRTDDSAEVIRRRMSEAIDQARDDAEHGRLDIFAGAPAFVIRSLARQTVQARTTAPPDNVDRVKLTSYQAGPGDVRLCGAPALFATAMPTLRPNDRLTANVIGLGGTVAVTVVAGHGPAVDLEQFEAHLRNAIADLTPTP